MAEEVKAKTTESISPKNKKFVQLVAVLLLVLSVGFGGGWLGANSRSYQQQLSSSSQVAKTTVVAEGDLIAELAKNVSPSVVSIDVKTQRNVTNFFGVPNSYQDEGAGTGFVLTKEGVIITNRHVVPRGVTKVSVKLSDGTELTDVDVIGRTSESDPLDVAFLKVKDKKGKDLVPVKLADSAKTRVGDKVIAIGNALGQFQNTVTSGIVSGYGRKIEAGNDSGTGGETLQNLFQTDAAINPGNSGGPLVNMNGEVIGINTAIAGSAQNIGFAIPVNDVKGLINSVFEKGKLERPYLGVRYVELTDDYATQLGIEQKRGAYIVTGTDGTSSIVSGSPAEKAGLKEKDIITKVGNDKVDENNSLTSLLQKHKVGEVVELTVVRDGKEQKISVTLEAAPQG